jgi:hypothetical protein
VPTPISSSNQSEDEKDEARGSKKDKETEEHRQQREDTNKGNRDDVYTEGNVVEVGPGTPPSYMIVGNRDGLVVVQLLCGDQCPTLRPGDYVELDGTKQDEHLFTATDVTIAGR